VGAALLFVSGVFGEQVDVGDRQRLARRGDVPRQTAVVHRDRRLAEGKVRQREVLRELEAQLLRRTAAFGSLREIQRARVAARDPPGLAEDHLEQLVEVSLVREGDADARELGELLIPLLLALLRDPFREERSGM